ncbi:MAG TPA: hypothetical protein VI854_04875 [Acidimicrobiia bacterium]|nr:hypothetical protein [Acidimicrobiia bacterium]
MRSADEYRHEPGRDPLWEESWYLDFARADGVGGFTRLALYPNLGVAWWWSHLVTPGGLVAVRDHEVPIPRSGLEIRTDGLWADLICETPMEHWSVGLEAFGVRFDDPAEAWGALDCLPEERRRRPGCLLDTRGDGKVEAAVGLDVDAATGMPRGAAYAVAGSALDVAVLGAAPVLVTGPEGRSGRLARALCRFDDGSGGGYGWAEWLVS